MPSPSSGAEPLAPPPSLATIAREWTRLGFIGFGGPPAHLVLLRTLVVERRRWIPAAQFEDAIAAAGLLPGPASTQVAIYTAGVLGGPRGALIGGLGFILPGLLMVLALAALLLAAAPPLAVLAAGAGAGAAVPAVAVQAGMLLLPDSRARATGRRGQLRWVAYVAAGALGAALAGAAVVLVLLGAGLLELVIRRGRWGRPQLPSLELALPAVALAALTTSTLGALAWTAFKVGALAYGGGFVIVPLMRADAVLVHGWMTDAQFLSAVAVGQITPGPVTNTIAVVGWAAAGLPGALLGSAVAFAPSLLLIAFAGHHFERVRASARAQAFLLGSGPAALGAILGSAVPLAAGIEESWQWALLALSAAVLLPRRLGVIWVLLLAALLGILGAVAGLPVPR